MPGLNKKAYEGYSQSSLKINFIKYNFDLKNRLVSK